MDFLKCTSAPCTSLLAAYDCHTAVDTRMNTKSNLSEGSGKVLRHSAQSLLATRDFYTAMDAKIGTRSEYTCWEHPARYSARLMCDLHVVHASLNQYKRLHSWFRFRLFSDLSVLCVRCLCNKLLSFFQILQFTLICLFLYFLNIFGNVPCGSMRYMLVMVV